MSMRNLFTKGKKSSSPVDLPYHHSSSFRNSTTNLDEVLPSPERLSLPVISNNLTLITTIER